MGEPCAPPFSVLSWGIALFKLSKPYFEVVMRIRQMENAKKEGFKGAKCYYCNRSMTSNKTALYKQNPGLLATFEHIVPRLHNGGNDKGNILICCARCNQMKGSMSYNVFYPFANVILKQYPDVPTVFLRKVLNQYILFLAETAIRSSHSKRVALSAALLHVNEISKEL